MSSPRSASRADPLPLSHQEVPLPQGSTLAAHKTLVRTVTGTLKQAFATLPERDRETATLYVLAGDYSTFAVRQFAGRYHDAERRLRPSDSLAMETAELIRPFTTASEHHGDCYVLDCWPYDGPPPEARPQSRTDRAAVVCELAGDEDGFRAITTVWSTSATEQPSDDQPSDEQPGSERREEDPPDGERRGRERAGRPAPVAGRGS